MCVWLRTTNSSRGWRQNPVDRSRPHSEPVIQFWKLSFRWRRVCVGACRQNWMGCCVGVRGRSSRKHLFNAYAPCLLSCNHSFVYFFSFLICASLSLGCHGGLLRPSPSPPSPHHQLSVLLFNNPITKCFYPRLKFHPLALWVVIEKNTQKTEG